MSLINKIGEIINDQFKYPTITPLIEADPAAKCKSVNLVYTGTILVLRVQAPSQSTDPDPLLIFNPGGWKKMCDYIIFYNRDNMLYIFLCEMKSDTGGHETQLWNGFSLIKYIIQTAIRFLPANINILKDIKIKMVLFSSNANKIYYRKREDLVFPNDNKIKIQLIPHYCNYEMNLDNFLSG